MSKEANSPELLASPTRTQSWGDLLGRAGDGIARPEQPPTKMRLAQDVAEQAAKRLRTLAIGTSSCAHRDDS
jgi:hypothetical protein